MGDLEAASPHRAQVHGKGSYRLGSRARLDGAGTFRIGHFGNVTQEDITTTLSILEKTLGESAAKAA